MRQKLALILVLLLLLGCSKSPEPAPAPVSSEATPPAATTGDDVARLFPESGWSISLSFDDGTKETTEWWHRDGQRIISANKNGVYAVWHMTEVGLFRRDPFGGPDAPYLLFLPRDLKSPSAWQQTSGGASISFRLIKAVECGDHPYEKNPRGPNCWRLEMLNRNRLLRLYFMQGNGLYGASLLNLTTPADSYHRLTLREQPMDGAPVPRAVWVAEADKQPPLIPSSVPPITEITWEQFDAALAATVKGSAAAVQLSPHAKPWYLVGKLDTPLKASAMLDDERVTKWLRLSLSPSPCTYQVKGASPFLLAICGTPTDPGAQAAPTMMVTAWGLGEDELPKGLMWPVAPAPSKEISLQGHRITVDHAGVVTIQRSLGDPVGHVQTQSYRLYKERYFTYEGPARMERAADARYPQNPEGVLLAALFARHHGLKDELPTFFAGKAEGDRLLRTDFKILNDLAPSALEVGTLEPVTAPKIGEAAMKATPVSVQVGKPVGFVMHAYGCCNSFTHLWGSVTFTVDEYRQWKVERLELQQVQNKSGTKPVPATP